MIIVIRGTNGSGKSHAVRTILRRARILKKDVGEGSSLIRLQTVNTPVLVIGPYIDGHSMGGCDCIRQPSKIYALVDRAIEHRWNVLLEGVVLATRPWLRYHDGHDVRYAFFDPPVSACWRQIVARQKKKGRTSMLSECAMESKRARAKQMYLEAKKLGIITQRFYDAPIDATAWILRQLRGET